ncbi:MAG TPA: hypothetical protein VFX30_14415 [bacterium]|nr:hypothetical protein [bacterium]
MKTVTLAVLALFGVVTALDAAPLGIWSKAVKTTLGPKGRNVVLKRSVDTAFPKEGGFRMPAPEPCYDYAFVSRRDRNVDNIFFANTCTPELRSVTNNTSNRISFSSLASSMIYTEVAAVAIDLTDPLRPRPYLTTWNGRGGGDMPYYGFRDRFLPSFPAYGPYGWFAMVTTDTEWRNAVVRRGNLSVYSAEEPPIILRDDPGDTRTLGRISWIGALDASQPGYEKLVVSVRRGSYFENGQFRRDDVDRLYVLDPSSGDLDPLKDPSDYAHQDVAMEGREPATGKYGQKLAFIRNVYGLNRLWTCDLTLEPAEGEGGGYQCANAQMVTTDFHEPESLTGNYDWPCWSYDAKKIFFSFDGLRASTDDHPYSKIYVMNPDGTGLRRLNDANPDGTDNVDNDSYPACLPLMLQAAPPPPVSVQPYREPLQVYPYTRTYELAPYRCDETHACPSGMTCGTDHSCR